MAEVQEMANGFYEQANGLEELFGEDDDFAQDLMMSSGTPQGNDTPINDSFIAEQIEGDDDELANLMKEGDIEGGEKMDFNALNDRQLDVGNKADDAIDYEDFDDDELPDEESTTGGPVKPTQSLLPTLAQDTMDDDDELFGDSDMMDTSLGFSQIVPEKAAQDSQAGKDDLSDVASDHAGEAGTAEEVEEEMDDQLLQEYLLQQALLGRREMPTTEEANLEEWLKLEFPTFKRNEIPYWTRLLPPKPGRWQPKEHKKPKVIRPSKVNLDIEPDQKTLFTSTAATAVPAEPRDDLIHCETVLHGYEEKALSDESDSDEPLPNGLTMDDLDFICTEFDTLSELAPEDGDLVHSEPRIVDEDAEMFGFDDEFNDFEHPVKKRRLGMNAHDLVAIHQFTMPSFDDPEKMTAKLARQVVLDLNDSRLLVEEVDQEAARVRARPGDKTITTKTIKERLAHRFKTSNDAAYDLLKQNHQHKIRGQLSHMTIDHSTPAVRLQYPYYKVKLPINELRNYHRKKMTFKTGIAFNKPAKHKRKELRHKTTREIYATTKDLSFADNSSALLLEYSEEFPIMLSQAGMGNKVINYYRRKTADDNSRPKAEIGDTSVLLPEDKSPFHNFGYVDPGETAMALYNSMYRAPIFEQVNQPQDFLVVRETTGMNGVVHYLRKIDHLYVVGQELPSVHVPGTHSRMVTTASKNRLKAISYRIARRKKSHRIRVEDVTRHFPDTTDMQNRQKMKEFMVFSKEHKEWEMRNGESLPDEENIQTLIKPEDICLLESMQVGAQYLQDAGYAEDENDDEDNDKENENDSIEQQLAPWKTTKNFMQATQGKAMLKLYGEGDPSGRGEAFSFIKTSMKGGFKAVGGSVEDAINSKKDLGGHSYNVARQQKSYEDSIRSIWTKQKASLSSHIEPEDIDDEGIDGQIEDDQRNRMIRATPLSTPGPVRRRDDETATSFSRRSVNSQAQRYLRIVRKVWSDKAQDYVDHEHVETDAAVIKQYMRQKEIEELNATSIEDLVPTGDVEYDARQRKRIEERLAQLEKNKARRQQRDKTKAALNAASPSGAMSPDGDPSTPAPTSGKQVQATQRKCANCGQVGHIKTNKKLCPLLNGTIKQDADLNNAAFMGAPPTLS